MAEPPLGGPQAPRPASCSCLEFGVRRSWSPPGSASRSESLDQKHWNMSSRELTGTPLCTFFPKCRGGRLEGSLPQSPGGDLPRGDQGRNSLTRGSESPAGQGVRDIPPESPRVLYPHLREEWSSIFKRKKTNFC